MNHLAHAHLSFHQPGLLVGNFAADFVRGQTAMEAFPDDVKAGIHLHRDIDEYTDAHELPALGRQLLHPLHGKYAGVFLDIFYDFLLANNWHLYSPDQDLESFSKESYALFETRKHDFPEGLWDRLQRMISHNWLMGFASESGLRYTFERLAPRLNFKSGIDQAVDNLLANRTPLEEGFRAFYPDLLAFVKTKISGGGI